MNNFKNFQAKHNLKIISFNNPKNIPCDTNINRKLSFYSSNFILVTSKKINLPKYDEYVSNLHIKPNDIIVYTLLFVDDNIQYTQVTPMSKQSGNLHEKLLDFSTSRGESKNHSYIHFLDPDGDNNLQSDTHQSLIKTPDDQHIVIRFFEDYYKIY